MNHNLARSQSSFTEECSTERVFWPEWRLKVLKAVVKLFPEISKVYTIQAQRVTPPIVNPDILTRKNEELSFREPCEGQYDGQYDGQYEGQDDGQYERKYERRKSTGKLAFHSDSRLPRKRLKKEYSKNRRNNLQPQQSKFEDKSYDELLFLYCPDNISKTRSRELELTLDRLVENTSTVKTHCVFVRSIPATNHIHLLLETE